MSETEFHVGTLTPIMTEDIEETARILCASHQYNKLDDSDTWLETLIEEGYTKYECIKGVLYKVEDKEHDLENTILSYPLKDGRIFYIVSYYNGCCSFSTAIEDAVRNIQKD